MYDVFVKDLWLGGILLMGGLMKVKMIRNKMVRVFIERNDVVLLWKLRRDFRFIKYDLRVKILGFIFYEIIFFIIEFCF